MTEQTYQVAISRYFAAPPELVYRAFTDPEQLAQWFGPLAFHVPLDSVDVDARPGGHWRMSMVSHLDPAMQSPISVTFTEVVENQLLVGYELAENFPGVPDGTKFTMTVELHPEGEGTRLELRQGPFPEEMKERATVGWQQALAKLDGLLATPPHLRNSPEDSPEDIDINQE